MKEQFCKNCRHYDHNFEVELLYGLCDWGRRVTQLPQWVPRTHKVLPNSGSLCEAFEAHHEEGVRE